MQSDGISGQQGALTNNADTTLTDDDGSVKMYGGFLMDEGGKTQ